MQTRALRTLTTIDQVGSFAQAAAQLNMTLSAVSMQMKALEQELDVRLFDRAFRPPRLTPLGRRIAAKARDVIADEDQLLGLCAGGGLLSGRYRIGFISTASVRLLPGFLAMARKSAPAARFEVEGGLSEDLEEKVLQGRLDAAVVTASQDVRPALRYDSLGYEPLAYAVPKGVAELSLETLMRELPFLHFLPSTGIGKLTARHLARTKLGERANIIVMDGVEAIMECVKTGFGFTLLPVPDIERYADSSVVLRPSGDTNLVRELALALREGSQSHRQAAELRALFREAEK